jgi:hypothetical protein
VLHLKDLSVNASLLFATHTQALVNVASKRFRGLHNYLRRAVLIREAGATDALLGCGFDDGKAAASRRTPRSPHWAAAGGADYGENCELEFAMPETKKAAKKPPQSGKKPHSYLVNSIPDDV